MRIIEAAKVTEVVRRLCIEANCHLTDDLKTCITEAMESVRQDAWTAAVESEDAAREKLADYGVNVYYPTDDEMQEWYRAAEGVYDEFREMLGDELVDKAIEFRDAHKS